MPGVTYGHADGYDKSLKQYDTFGGVDKGEAKFGKPSVILSKILANAQADHKKCLEAAAANGKDPVDTCALTWGEVHQRYREWAQWRPPFETDERVATHRKYWSSERNIRNDNMARAIAGVAEPEK